jgi:hypothetical protein
VMTERYNASRGGGKKTENDGNLHC